MSFFHTDSPIIGSEESPDKLNRTDFAKKIGKGLKLNEDSPCLVVSLESKWGYGKTSFINLINHYYQSLNSKDQPITLNFNPWMIGDAKNIIQEFLTQFSTAIGLSSRGKKAQDAAKQLLSYSKIFSIAKFIPGAEPWATIIEKAMTGVGNASESIGKLKELNIEQQRSLVIKSLKKVKKPIIVFIDDLDRLPPSEVFQMVKTIKAVSDFPRTTFVLAFDYKYIASSLKRYGIENGNSYLDKIIQVRIHLPKINEKDLSPILMSELDQLANINLTGFFEGDQKRLSKIYHLCIKPYIKSPRELKRIFNRLRLIEPILRGEVCFSDLFALEVLAIKAPQIYEHIRTTQSAYTGRESENEFNIDKPEDVVDRFKEERESLINQSNKEDRLYLKELLQNIFPLLEGGFGGSNDEYYYNQGRIASSERLSIALSYGIPTGELSTKLIELFISNSSKRDEIKNQIASNNNVYRFSELLLRSIKIVSPTDPQEFIEFISELIDSSEIKKLDSENNDVFFNASASRLLWWTVEKVYQKEDQKKRREMLNTILKDSKHLSLSVSVLDHCLRQHGFYKKQETEAPEKQWLSESELEEAKKDWIACVTESIKSKNFLFLNEAGHIFFLFQKLEPSNVKGLIAPLFESDQDLDSLFGFLGKGGTDSVKGEYAEISEEYLELIGDVDFIRSRISKRLEQKDSLSERLKTIYNSVLTGDKLYFIDNSIAENF